MRLFNQSSSRGTVIYAIGDVHGEAERLRRLHELIRERHASRHNGLALKLVHLGDYVDRGPDSAGVIEAVRAFEADSDVTCISLRGNHEEMMLDALDEVRVSARADWVSNGGDKMKSSNLKVLVADNQPSVLRMYTKALGQLGHGVDTAGDLRSVQSHLDAAPYQILIIDLGLVGVDLEETLRTF